MLIATCGAVATGCSAPAPAPTTSEPDTQTAAEPPTQTAEPDAVFTALVDSQIAYAKEAGATEAQLAILDEARAAGVMSHELAMQSARDYMQCLNDVGIRAELVPSDDSGDFPDIDYRIYTQDLTVADQCDIKAFEFVDTVYQLQPAVQDHGRHVMADYSDDFIECLTAAGIDVPINVDDAVLAGAVFSASQGIQPFGDGMLPGGPIDCLTPYGLSDEDL